MDTDKKTVEEVTEVKRVKKDKFVKPSRKVRFIKNYKNELAYINDTYKSLYDMECRICLGLTVDEYEDLLLSDEEFACDKRCIDRLLQLKFRQSEYRLKTTKR